MLSGRTHLELLCPVLLPWALGKGGVQGWATREVEWTCLVRAGWFMKWLLVLVCSGRSWSGEQPGSACVCSPAREARPQAEAGHFPSEEFSPSRWLAACAGREWSRCGLGLGLGLEAAGAELRHPRAWLQAPAPPPTCATWPGTKLSEPGLLHEKFFLPERWL